MISIGLFGVLTRRVVVEQQLVNPFGLDGHRPSVLLKVLLWRLASCGSLANEVLDRVGVQGVEHPVKEVTVGIAQVILGARRIREVILELRKEVDHLWVNNLHREFRPVRKLACGNVLLPQGPLPAREDVLQVLQARGLERGQQVADCKKQG